ncbi:MAG TPA: hypothetical protein VHF26_18565 [Trebonia sp.]|nr:hypothetical protein [Trebonia sp.]
MTAAASTATAAVFAWLGMVVAISFIEAPLKFRAPEVTVRIGLDVTLELIKVTALLLAGIMLLAH